ncbi:zinc metalloprotease HtpX [uncultured Thiohalocapsa sp.]|uniref:zinc metalloprotease HtpX n=1 Tax=uncultured Thiohalocapsa sp. TaxID=768990 RepID=UPI0025F3C79C|nr:zinc metalloprotease HtpX [uncultured Thiohalocapsa sp.]
MDQARLKSHKWANGLQSALLVATLAALLGLLAWIVGDGPLAVFALALVTGLYFANPAASPRLVTLLYPGRLLHPAEAPRQFALLAELARRAGLPRVPRLYYIPSRVMNAFATGGRDDALIAVSDGLLRRLDLREQAGVLAHEVSHVANGDLAVMAFADMVSRIAGAFGLFGQILFLVSLPTALVTGADMPWLALLILLAAPTVSALVQLALSRNREYEADLAAAELTGDPAGLAAALDKLERYQGRYWEQILMPGRGVPEPSLLRTHPDTQDRIARLLALVPARRSPLALSGDARPGAYASPPLHPRWRPPGLWY